MMSSNRENFNLGWYGCWKNQILDWKSVRARDSCGAFFSLNYFLSYFLIFWGGGRPAGGATARCVRGCDSSVLGAAVPRMVSGREPARFAGDGEPSAPRARVVSLSDGSFSVGRCSFRIVLLWFCVGEVNTKKVLLWFCVGEVCWWVKRTQKRYGLFPGGGGSHGAGHFRIEIACCELSGEQFVSRQEPNLGHQCNSSYHRWQWNVFLEDGTHPYCLVDDHISKIIWLSDIKPLPVCY